MTGYSGDDRSLLQAVLGDGRFLLALTAIGLLGSGGFAILQSISGQLLPHDMQALGMNATALSQHSTPNLVKFMFHDRVAFGGTLIAIGAAYLWIIEFALPIGAVWAWWILALSGSCGFLSFLAYLGYGYFDTWHGVATAFLLPVFVAGMWRSRRLLSGPLKPALIWQREYRPIKSTETIGRTLLLLSGAGLMIAGGTILVVGMTFVFVPQDVAFIGLTPENIRAVSPTLVPLLAHDRAGFGGGLFTVGVILVMLMRHAPISRSLVQVTALMGIAGFGCALGVHFAVGYTSVTHLLPAYLGLLLFIGGMLFFAQRGSAARSLAAAK